MKRKKHYISNAVGTVFGSLDNFFLKYEKKTQPFVNRVNRRIAQYKKRKKR